MLKIIFYTYIFVRWTGGWGGHTGLCAWIFFLLWTAYMALSVCMAAFGPFLTIVGLGKLFRYHGRQIQNFIGVALRNPAGRAFLLGHLGSMAVTALVCYIAYYFTGENQACAFHWGIPSMFEWGLFAWYLYSVYVFFKNGKWMLSSIG